ncbi:hypothetical protein [Solimicrobium silvestre]|uniref:Replication-relaxation n=1 Tax=Solimicrobium silvestre TaxID=2099400 RepID=A0A2S9GYD4_9BURK|nr:hypothetical protein [Solimicrobium silvestre]PRC92737.1 hypothetical protein S2091_2467 [Solimicrobium silvestre]
MGPSKTKFTPPPRMSFLEKQAIADAKVSLILEFLSDGEIYTDVAVTSCLLGSSLSSARRTLKRMVKEYSLKTETHLVRSRACQIYGISTQGVALSGNFDCRPFELGKTNPSFITHHLKTQKARLAAIDHGWTDWVPERSIHGKGYLKVPDALVTNSEGFRVAVEIELNIKTTKRYSEICSAHLQSIAKGHWHEVHYLCPEKLLAGVERIFAGIEFVSVKGDRVSIQQKHRQRFKFFCLDAWPIALQKDTL